MQFQSRLTASGLSGSQGQWGNFGCSAPCLGARDRQGTQTVVPSGKPAECRGKSIDGVKPIETSALIWPKIGLVSFTHIRKDCSKSVACRQGRVGIPIPWRNLSRRERHLLEGAFWMYGSSRQGLATLLGLSRSKTNGLIAELVAQGLVEETGQRPSTGGRRPQALRLHPDLGLVAGIDIGAKGMDIALLKPDMSVVTRHREATDVREGPGAVLSRVRTNLTALLRQHGGDGSLLAIGMGVPGPVNFATGQLVTPPLMPNWDSFSIRDYMRDFTAAPCYIDNDANVMALGVLWRLRRQHRNFLVIKVGTGIGCGIVCSGEIYRGHTGSAGDVGHISVDENGPLCTCGNRGCVEAMAGGPAIAELAHEAVRRGESPFLKAWMERHGEIGAEALREASRAGDPTADRIIIRAGGLVGQMLASVVNFFNPSHVFVGGSMANLGPLFLAAIRQRVNLRSTALSARHLEVAPLPFVSDAGTIGAGVLAVRESLRDGETMQ
ncbi:ROK family protein [Mesorhizobium sp. NPDC059054]|uniref:ROK family protein n=1 Tax=Mesorhizobium sp. NPDC059054 TaxID=3346711 RepID=UPI0036BC5CD7